jgi:hypothetical protein
MQSYPLPCYLIPLGPKYPPQHSILDNPQPTFLPQTAEIKRFRNRICRDTTAGNTEQGLISTGNI